LGRRGAARPPQARQQDRECRPQPPHQKTCLTRTSSA
jgi:hypothetical protein